MKSLRTLAECTKKTVTEIMTPHKDVLVETIPPKKHLLRYQPVNAQIGVMVRSYLNYLLSLVYSYKFV